MKQGLRKYLALTVSLTTLALAGCEPTRPPLDLLDGASRALGNARNAGAPTFAATEYRAAGQRFDEAQSAESTRDYDAAAQLAHESSAESELAIARTRVAKSRRAIAALREQNMRLQNGEGESGRPAGNAPGDDAPHQGFSAPEQVHLEAPPSTPTDSSEQLQSESPQEVQP